MGLRCRTFSKITFYIMVLSLEIQKKNMKLVPYFLVLKQSFFKFSNTKSEFSIFKCISILEKMFRYFWKIYFYNFMKSN